MNNFNLYLVVFIHLFVHLSNAQNISVFSQVDHQGRRSEISIANCSNLPQKFGRNVTSINTQNNCARLYDALNCTGDYIEVMARSPSHNNLNDWAFAEKTQSVGPCPHECDLSVTGFTPYEEEQVDLKIYSRKNFEGMSQQIKVQGCTPIPAKFISRLMSVNVFGQCLQFYSNSDCKHAGPDVDTIELRVGTPSHKDISTWYFPEARAVSHCSYKCNGTARNETMMSASDPLVTSTSTERAIISTPMLSSSITVAPYTGNNNTGNGSVIVVKKRTDIESGETQPEVAVAPSLETHATKPAADDRENKNDKQPLHRLDLTDSAGSDSPFISLVIYITVILVSFGAAGTFVYYAAWLSKKRFYRNRYTNNVRESERESFLFSELRL